MYLKRLELVGFKSFANKTTFSLTNGITAIVGPNGSGKSNVIDAVRWLLGEREAKNIRGAKAEDLIFAGTPQRSRMGLGQVTMVFDNRTKFFPLDYEEISVTRKVSRDGISQYLINEAEVRLKDIIDFFAKSRLGTKGLTIVNQGNSDIFVRATPQDRRVMIEEALGLRQYQIKKHDAELRMEATRLNLDKVKALIEEIAPHLRLLRRQASKWEKQSEVEKGLRELEQQYFGGRLEVLEKEVQSLKPKFLDLDNRQKTLQTELQKLQFQLQEVEKSGPKGDKNYNEFKKRQGELLNRRSIIQKELGRLEGQIEFLLKQPKSEIKASEAVGLLEESRELIKNILTKTDWGVVRELLSELVKKMDRILAGGGEEQNFKAKELETSKEKLSADLLELDRELAELVATEDKLAEEQKTFNSVFKKAFESVEKKKDELTLLDNERNRTLYDQERINIRRQELENLASQNGRKLAEFEEVLRLHSGQFSQNEFAKIDFQEVEKRMLKLRGELSSIGELDPAMMKEAQETEARHNFLSKQSEDLEKASEDLGKLIKDLDEKIHTEFSNSLKSINDRFNEYFKLMFGGGRASLKLQKLEIKNEKLESEEVELEKLEEDADKEHKADHGSLEVFVSIPRKKISGLEMLSGGERSLVSIAALFAIISVSPPPFLVLDEVDAPLDERNARRFAELIKSFSKKTQFLLVTHNRATMEAADVLYGITMGEDGTSRMLSLKLESAEALKQ